MTDPSNPPQTGDLLTVAEAQVRTRELISRTLHSAPSAVSDLTRHLALSQGKGIRTVLVLQSAVGEDGLVSPDAVAVAAAIELFHLATLVHDDIIDDAALRRGIPTLQQQFGKKKAVICGDYLLCLAASAVAPLHGRYQEYSDLLALFSQSLSRTCLGELMQYSNNRNLALTTPGYLRIVAGKTSALFYTSAYAGALVGGCSREEARTLARFGRCLGMVFQMVDDCKDYEFAEAQAQKTVGKDILEGVVTLPLIYALAKEPELRDLAVTAFEDQKSAQLLTQKVQGAGGTQQCRQLAERYAQKGEALLANLTPSKAKPLRALMHKALGASAAF